MIEGMGGMGTLKDIYEIIAFGFNVEFDSELFILFHIRSD
jgi:hypothetical protein